MAAKTTKYELLGKNHQGFDAAGGRVEYVKGDLVPLTESQYEAFQDKFKEVKVAEPVKAPEPVKEPVKVADVK